MGKYDHLSREELIACLEQAEKSETARLQDRLDGERRIAQALVLMLKNYNSNYEEDIMRIVLERYQADRAFLFKFDWEKGTNNNIYEINSPGIAPEMHHLQNLPNEALADYLEQFRQGIPLVVDDVEELPETTYQGTNRMKAIFKMLKLKSAILFPMRIYGELWGYVGMETVKNYRKWSEDDIGWLRAFTDILSLGVSQRFVRAQADKNERRFTELFQHMPIGYIRHRLIYDENNQPVDYEYLEANPAFERQTGLSRDKCIGKTARQLTGTINEEMFRICVEVAHTGKQIQLDYVTDKLKRCFYSVLYSPKYGEFIALFYDVTERIQASNRIRENETKLRNIFENLPVGIISFDPQRQFVSANHSAMRIFNIEEEDFDLRLPAHYGQRLEKEHLLEFEVIYDPVSQQRLSANQNLPESALFLTTKIIKYTDGQGYLLIAVDNTRIHRANRELTLAKNALTENLTRLSLVLESGKIYPWYLDTEANRIDLSEELYKAFGQPKPEESPTIEEVIADIHPDDLSLFYDYYEKLRNKLVPRVKFDIRLNLCKQGYLWCEITATLEKQDNNQHNSKWLGFLSIIQKRKDNEQKLIEAMKKAEESDQLKSAFLANVSHEIRTPLNAIIGFSELLAQTEDEAEKAAYLEIVNTNNQLLLNLINDILDLSKIESGRIDLKETPVNISELCEELCQIHQLKAHSGIKILPELPVTPLIMKTDRYRLTQLFSNLISNALKNTIQGSISVGYRLKGSDIECFVRDTGKGIPSDKQEIIFNRFEKLDSTVQGFGLGLSICKSILCKMGGHISLTSEVGKGTEFRFSLPYKSLKNNKG